MTGPEVHDDTLVGQMRHGTTRISERNGGEYRVVAIVNRPCGLPQLISADTIVKIRPALTVSFTCRSPSIGSTLTHSSSMRCWSWKKQPSWPFE